MTATYADMVKALAKPGADIVASLTGEKAHCLHMAVGVSGEAGELLDAIKKHVIYNKPLDLENVIEELGDLEFYLEGIRQGLGIDRNETLAHNHAKLSIRYNGLLYSDQAAQERADKASADNIVLDTVTRVSLAAQVAVNSTANALFESAELRVGTLLPQLCYSCKHKEVVGNQEPCLSCDEVTSHGASQYQRIA